MTEFEKFITENGVKKKDIASYLGVSNAFITQLVSGKRQLPAEKLALIKAKSDWNTSMFERPEFNRYSEISTTNTELLEVIKSQQRTIEMQARTIELLEKRTASLDAQEDAPAGCAVASGQ
jgi:transcriptional regulator with XRE-family HTH domain